MTRRASERAACVLTALGVGVPVLWPDAAHDVGQVHSRPGERHAVAAQPGAELLSGQAQPLQLVFVLWGDASVPCAAPPGPALQNPPPPSAHPHPP